MLAAFSRVLARELPVIPQIACPAAQEAYAEEAAGLGWPEEEAP